MRPQCMHATQPQGAHLDWLFQRGPPESRVPLLLRFCEDVVDQPVQGGRQQQPVWVQCMSCMQGSTFSAGTGVCCLGASESSSRMLWQPLHTQGFFTSASHSLRLPPLPPLPHVLYRWCCLAVRRSRSMKPSSVSGSASSSSCCSAAAAAVAARAASA